MKKFKFLLLALIATLSFASANAQIRVRIGGRRHHYYHHHYYRHHRYHRPYHHRHW